MVAKDHGPQIKDDAQYERSRDWIKSKCSNRLEVVIGGYTDPGGSRTGLGALLLGYYEGGRLKYAGKVGTGFHVVIPIRRGPGWSEVKAFSKQLAKRLMQKTPTPSP